MSKSYDVIVLGLGAVGSATLYQLSNIINNTQKQLTILGIDQFAPPHTVGSSHGETRITRQAIHRHDGYVSLAKRSNEIWKEIRELTQNKFGALYVPTGGLVLGTEADAQAEPNINSDMLFKTRAAAIRNNIPHSNLNYMALQEKFPQLKLSPHLSAYYEYSMGYLQPENCIKAQLQLAKQNGAQIQLNEKIVHFTYLDNNCIQLANQKGEIYLTKKLIVCAGPWINTILPDHYQQFFKIYRQVLYWFEVEKKFVNAFKEDQFPVFIWDLGKDNIVYGFPILGQENYLKIAAEDAGDYIRPYADLTPEFVDRTVSMDEKRYMFAKFIKPYFHGITDRCVKAVTCLYTVAKDWQFVIDYLPGYSQQIIIASPCSGHGFKHSAAIGEALAELAIDGESRLEVMQWFGGVL